MMKIRINKTHRYLHTIPHIVLLWFEIHFVGNFNGIRYTHLNLVISPQEKGWIFSKGLFRSRPNKHSYFLIYVLYWLEGKILKRSSY